VRISKLVTAALALAAATVPAAPAATAAAATPGHTLNARQGAVRAAYSYRYLDASRTYARGRLRIWNGGRLIVNHPTNFSTGPRPGGPRMLVVRQLDGAGPPEVVLNLYSGGAHCCASSWIYTGAHRTVKSWGDSPPALRDVDGDGSAEFHGFDSSFGYAFGPFGTSGFPVKVWRYTGTGVSDVTRSFPAEVQADMAQQYARYQAAVSGRAADAVRGALAAYAADGYTLGQGDQAMGVVQSAVDAGEAGTAVTDADPSWEPDYIGRLRALLHKAGYA
jgi:hypothetical protein